MTTIIPGLYGLDSASAWRALSKDPQKYISRFADSKTVQKEVDYFNKKAPTFTSVDELMKDRRALQYLLDSYGLGSEINNAGRIKKILTEDPTAENALANKLIDSRFKAMASNLRLDQGMDKLQRLSFRDTLEEKYVQNEFEEALGQQDTALRQAAYFARNSSGIASVYNLMGDQILRNVVTSTFNLPAELAIQPIETQAAVIAKRVDVTKFGAGAGSVTSSQLTRAKSDHALITSSLAVSDAALKQINTLQTYMDKLSNDYANLGALTDPMGSNAALIALQENAVPDLLRFEEMMRDGDKTLESVTGRLTSLQKLITDAKKSGSDLVDLKAQFTAVANAIQNSIDNSISETYAGNENILMNGANDTISVVIDTAGTTITMNRFDATALKDYVTNASTAFNAITSHTDMTNILAAEARVMMAGENATAMHNKIKTDFDAMDLAVSNGNTTFAATLNTGELMRGKQSLDDGLARVTQIETLLGKIGELAKTSKNMAPGADRSALETQFDTYRNEIRDLIENAGAAGLDNFLDNLGNQEYEIIGGKKIDVRGGIDLATTIADILDAGGLSDQTSAAALETSAIMLTNRTDSAKAILNESKPLLDRVVNNYDPRGKLDSQIADLKAYIGTIIDGATVDGKNLLGADQTTIRLDGLSTGGSLSFRAQNSFGADFTTAIDNVLATMSGGPSAIMSAMYNLTDVVSSAKRVLGSDNRVATIEQGKLGATIDTLDPQNTSEASNMYKTNAYTQKFLTRYLSLAGSNGANTQGNYLTSLFGSTDTASATANLMSLALSLKV